MGLIGFCSVSVYLLAGEGNSPQAAEEKTTDGTAIAAVEASIDEPVEPAPFEAKFIKVPAGPGNVVRVTKEVWATHQQLTRDAVALVSPPQARTDFFKRGLAAGVEFTGWNVIVDRVETDDKGRKFAHATVQMEVKGVSPLTNVLAAFEETWRLEEDGIQFVSGKATPDSSFLIIGY